MVFLLLIFAVSGIGLVAALLVPGAGDLVLLAGPMALASLYLLWPVLRKRFQEPPDWILVDGSNVMYWNDNTPSLETLREVVGRLRGMGFVPGVIFDANAGYLLVGKYQHHYAMGIHLGLPEAQVMVVPKGTVADEFILTAARDYGARVVTNDRYRDWADSFPEVKEDGFLIPGGYRDGALWLDRVLAPN